MIVTSENERPAKFVAGVFVNQRMAHVLDRITNFTEIRSRNRGRDPEFDETLIALRYAALSWEGSVNRTPSREFTEPLANWCTPDQIASQLGITPSAIRKAIRAGTLRGQKHEGRWRISRADYENYRRAR